MLISSHRHILQPAIVQRERERKKDLISNHTHTMDTHTLIDKSSGYDE